MSKYRILGFKSGLRLDCRRQNGQNEKQQPDHPASLRDSLTSSTRIGFSVHTTAKVVIRRGERLPDSVEVEEFPDVGREETRAMRLDQDFLLYPFATADLPSGELATWGWR